MKKNSRKPIQRYKKIFGKDLIIESEGEYKLLRRKSSLYTPSICFYSIDTQTVMQYLPKEVETRIKEIANSTKQSEFVVEDFPIKISDKYFEEFNLNSEDVDAVFVQPNGFINELKKHKSYYGKVTYIDTSKEYDIFEDKLFEQDYNIKLEYALEKHIEIFYKDKNDYEHQCEFRAILPNKRLSAIKKGTTIYFYRLSRHMFEDKTDEPINANGIDFLCYVKNQGCFACVTMRKSK